MKSPKNRPQPQDSPTTTDLRAQDPTILRAEIAHFIARISEKTSREPHKAAFILVEWIDRPASAKKKAA